MAFSGQDIVDVGSTRVGQKYVLGAQVPLNNPDWKGPWDCAEFTSWCTYQAYGLIFGAGGVHDVKKAEPYSGFWYSEAKKNGKVIRWQDALNIPGAFLIKAPPGQGKIGHVAISMGDGKRTLEARGQAFGVNIFDKAGQRPWSIGCLLPGVEYASEPATIDVATIKSALSLPAEFLALHQPHLKGAHIITLQKAIAAKGIDPGPIDGDFGPMTHAAVVSFQVTKGLEIDGIVGPATGAALGLPSPIVPSAADEAAWEELRKPATAGPITLAAIPLAATGATALAAAGATELVDAIALKNGAYRATTTNGLAFIVGSSTNFSDDMHRTGLFQGSRSIADSVANFGIYKAGDYEPVDRQWAHFLVPTFKAEGGRYATLNTYDRAAFTFGAPQLAAHTPDMNFIIYLRSLLTLADADKHFPELTLANDNKGVKRVHLKKAGGLINLEEAVLVTRPNGIKEKQLAKLMAYLNPSPTRIDDAELSAAARLMNWLRQDPRAKQLQITVFVDHAKSNLARAKTKVPAFNGSKWKEALWIMDIMHQGRGTFADIKAAFNSGNPVGSLSGIGASKYRERISTIRDGVAALEASGVLNGFTV
ncbi:peptidoglycan-binding domain-containing protein [Rhizobium sp. L43]|uniref:peptidoglycan-binding domain-containing protein n=1 Tax=Rhizobium sp. L43 TaxID=2035452 RepID=UPI000BEAAA6E|nr:peptidoglycan-binding domain-containing protein [Rhizobium sp. L43]PDS77904.1 peptidoglycan-binding protein [Rhizobium sp. L43]